MIALIPLDSFLFSFAAATLELCTAVGVNGIDNVLKAMAITL